VKELSITRISGMATGMDTDSIVKKLMDVERMPLNRLQQNQQKQMWLIDSYRQWNSDLFTFRSNTLFNMKLSGTFNTFDVDTSQTNSVSAKASSSAVAGTYSMSVKQLAESASIIGHKVKIDTTKSLGDASQGIRQLTADTTISVKVYNDPTNPTVFQTADIDVKTTDKINDVVARINTATDDSGKSLGLQAMYDENLQQFIVKTKNSGAETKIDLSMNNSAESQAFLSKTLGIGDKASVTGDNVTLPVTITTGTNDVLTIDLGGWGSSTILLNQGTYSSPQELVQEINKQISTNGKLATNISAIVDEFGKIKLTSSATGSQSSLSISGTGTTAIGMAGPTSSTGAIGTLVANGKNADIIFNGEQINTLSSNNVTLLGIDFTLKSPTVDASGNPITSSVTVSQNIDTTVNNIKDFVDKYNDLLDRMTKSTSEAIYKDFLPLLDEQRSEMTEKQIELWEGKAKSGLLRGDSIMSNLINKMRNEMSSIVSNGSSYNSLASIGISSRNYQDKGKLYIDETKLKEALEKDPDAIQKLFSQNGDTSKGTNGLINRLSDVMNEGIKNLTTKAGSSGNSQFDQSVIGKLLSRMQSDITRQNDRLAKKEDQYYRQFAAMEAAVEKFNQQGSWLFSQMNGGK
jgi:flagellar hook-associated protein 2